MEREREKCKKMDGERDGTRKGQRNRVKQQEMDGDRKKEM